MSDLLDDPREGENAPEFSVTELSGAIKKVIEGNFGHVRIRAEIGRVSFPRSGHVYLDLKDEKSVISGVMWKGVASKLAMRPEEGMEVVAIGRITTFGGQSKYQIVIESMKPAGVGALMAMLEKRKAQLAAEGLFDPARKRSIPFLPEVIGVVTSPSGAVIRDILHRLRDRFPRKVLIWPVAVQGEKCALEVVRGIAGFNALTPGGALPRPDLIIVARGGGSLEDLWGFNEESVVRAAAASEIPLISAVGHETDTTLIDFAADKRAPTPTAAAELAVPVRLELLSWVDDQSARLTRALTHGVSQRGQRLKDLARALPRPETLLEGPTQRLDRAAERLPNALRRNVDQRRLALSETTASLRPANLRRAVEAKREALGRRADRLSLRPISREIAQKHKNLEALNARFAVAAKAQLRQWQDQLSTLERLRTTLGYEATLERGYAVVWDGTSVVTRAAAAQKAAQLEVQFADGRVAISGAENGASPAPKTKAKPASKAPDKPEQGSLF
ncbi:exodeoxyribonuclease VII large subunit [Cognatishimia sp. SS12]|uniref:exodeoxyribonuclease VII large subunit n=1 Tax=Cognatishimia sp. SS12 TaxID=2979465 RepID=UPI00232EC015|nr:exodeoxyribonuclease VII large subunit [Cognatishimia sp. SS12]MDC0738201.1 exodeoxyribonuclease VII large subunit [Cognatishimia sp. SS12]